MWRGPPLHQKSRQCRPPNPFSVFSLQVLKEEEGGQAKKKGEVVHLGREGDKRENTKKQQQQHVQIH